MLPDINGRIGESRQQINLRAFGFSGFGSAFSDVPTIVGLSTSLTPAFLCHSLYSTSARSTARVPRRITSKRRATPTRVRGFRD